MKRKRDCLNSRGCVKLNWKVKFFLTDANYKVW